MSEHSQLDDIAALIALHRGLPRKGPGDRQFTLGLLAQLPLLPGKPRIADLGCGAGAASLLLAQHFQTSVKAVDASSVFIEELKINARRAGLAHLVEPICIDMAALDWPNASIDLLWSEGAAYSIGFRNALRAWYPLLAKGGLAVVSEMSWFNEAAPEPARDFWNSAYPGMGTEKENVARAAEVGFSVLFTERLPSGAWWNNYYTPLRERMRSLDTSRMNQKVIHETEQEISLFEEYSDHYGYTFYVLAVGREGLD